MEEKQVERDEMSSPPGPAYWSDRLSRGWRLVAVEWERDSEDAALEAGKVEVPYGYRIAEDCRHLVEDPAEKEALVEMLEMIIADRSMSEIAEGLNAKGFRTRQGTAWTPVAVFNLIPRLVETAPQVYVTPDWSERRRRIYGAAGTSTWT